MTEVLERETAESLSVLVTTNDDPAGTPVQFAFLHIGARPTEFKMRLKFRCGVLTR
jgi:hypothetical protein